MAAKCRLLVVGIVGCGCLGCQSAAPSGANVPVPSAGPTLISPGSSAAQLPTGAPLGNNKRSQSLPLLDGFGRGGDLIPAASRSEGNPLSPPAAPFKLRSVPKEKTPFQLISDRQTTIGNATDQNSPKTSNVLTYDALQGVAPLTDVISPRKLREAQKSPIKGSTEPPKRPIWSDPRLRRLPPVFESARSALKKRELPQQPIPLYPEVPPPGSRPREDL